MALSRENQKFERLTITLVPTGDERSFRNVPSTFSSTDRAYVWRKLQELNYMIVPRKISSNEVKVDIYVNARKGKKGIDASVVKLVETFVQEKIRSEWRGLTFSGIAKAAAAQVPESAGRRGTIEEILGATLQE